MRDMSQLFASNMRFIQRAAFAATVAAGVASCGSDASPTQNNDRIVAQAVARPSTVPPGAAFDVEITATNVTSAPITLTFSSGCAFTYRVTTAAAQVVATPSYLCTAVIRTETLAPGGVLRETYRYATGEASFPVLAAGTFRVVPALNTAAMTGLVIRAADIEVR